MKKITLAIFVSVFLLGCQSSKIPLNFSEEKDELVAILIEDVMDFVDCQSWDEMKDTELEDWYTWSTYADD